ncbi:MAG: ADP-ribosyltransferase [Cellulosilyticaceae bacterium]
MKIDVDFREFNNGDDAFRWGREYYGHWLKDFQKNEVYEDEVDKSDIYKTFLNYCSGRYVPINRCLRHSETKLFNSEDKVFANIMINEINKFTIPENIVAYRVIDRGGLQGMANGKIEKGTVLVDKALLSTGLIYDNLKNKRDKDCLLQILVPKGTHAIYVGLISKLDEHELILTANTKMKVVRMYRYDKKKVYQCILM